MKKSVAALFVVVVMAVVVHETAAVECQPSKLLVCAPPMMRGVEPSADCCSRLKEQEPCYCTYIKNPAYKQYLDSPYAAKVAAACKVTIPTNC